MSNEERGVNAETLRENGNERTWRTTTTSSAMAMIHTIAIAKPIKHLAILPGKLRPSVLIISESVAMATPTPRVASRMIREWSD